MSNARVYSNCPGPKVHSASNNFKSPDISDPVPVRAGDGVDIDRCITTDAAKIPAGDSYVAIKPLDLFRFGTAVSCLSCESHTAEEIAALIQELGIKYTLDDRLNAIATGNGAYFLAPVEDVLENGICDEQVQCACHAYLQLSCILIQPHQEMQLVN